MANESQGKKVAVLIAPRWTEQIEFVQPRQAVEDAVAYIRCYFEQAKPAGVICHAPWTLIEVGVVEGRTLTSYHEEQARSA